MGDPRKQRKKYSPPMHPWKAERINEENKLQEDYGLKNKTEIWKMSSKLKRIKAQAKQLITKTGKQAEKEEQLFRKRLEKLGLMAEGTKLENVLDLGVKDILERRLQTHVFRRGFAKSMKQARQFITHGHVMLNSRKLTSPSYILLAGQEAMITFRPTSGLADAEHPERKVALKKGEQKAEIKAEKKEEAKEKEDVSAEE
ncbi:MAG: 30S ribosomal protein S4 [Nanoarchaeota archaeon]|nr:30S ribosomal protein S4 [Nanoarchaeota archaeon]